MALFKKNTATQTPERKPHSITVTLLAEDPAEAAQIEQQMNAVFQSIQPQNAEWLLNKLFGADPAQVDGFVSKMRKLTG